MTRDPEMRYTPSGAAVVTFTIATNRSFVSDGEKKEEADFHRAVAWNKLAELCNQLLKKGNRVFISGRLTNRSWQTPEGQTRYITEIVVEDMILLTNKGGEFGDYSGDSEPEAVPARAADEMPKESGKSQESRVKDTKVEEKAAPKPEKEEVEDLDDLPF
jgi:single-strand DNA-binding protein